MFILHSTRTPHLTLASLPGVDPAKDLAPAEGLIEDLEVAFLILVEDGEPDLAEPAADELGVAVEEFQHCATSAGGPPKAPQPRAPRTRSSCPSLAAARRARRILALVRSRSAACRNAVRSQPADILFFRRPRENRCVDGPGRYVVVGVGGEVEAIDVGVGGKGEADVDLDLVPDDDRKDGDDDDDVEDTLRTSGFRMPATLITLRTGRLEAGTVNCSSRGVLTKEE